MKHGLTAILLQRQRLKRQFSLKSEGKHPIQQIDSSCFVTSEVILKKSLELEIAYRASYVLLSKNGLGS
jgi:hypothetical protein